jgi:hypothetical protein
VAIASSPDLHRHSPSVEPLAAIFRSLTILQRRRVRFSLECARVCVRASARRRVVRVPASFVFPEHHATVCRFVLRALGFGAAGWLSVFHSRLVSSPDSRFPRRCAAARVRAPSRNQAAMCGFPPRARILATPRLGPCFFFRGRARTLDFFRKRRLAL